ncbi:MAG: hypothetical protein H6831_13185 [Planctomycetes bacterium]|nr:hypothetical protein [Planctomycetota bacterium]MCB9905353.1 hypothetical protein [Planctomycetota bacterium]
MADLRLPLIALGLSAGFIASCGGGGSSTSGSGSSAGNNLNLVSVSNGFGELLPFRSLRMVDGAPTTEVVALRSMDDILANVTAANPILPPVRFESSAIVPGGNSGNHYFVARFDRALSLDSILSDLPSDDGMRGTISVVALDPATGNAVQVAGRAFINGKTYAGTPTGTPQRVPLQQWVARDAGATVVNTSIDNDLDGIPDGQGFPGTDGEFGGASSLLGENVFVFVADSDGKLSTHETFPAGRELRLVISTEVYAASGQQLAQQAKACSTVGPDVVTPEASFSPPPQALLRAFPRTVDQSGKADPETEIEIQFTEPVQPWTFGSLPSRTIPTPSAAFSVQFGPQAARTEVPCTVRPISPFDLTTFIMTPSFTFPGEGPEFSECGVFNQVDLTIFGNQFLDLSSNQNTRAGATTFFVGEGPGIVNAPVTPDAIFIGRGGSEPGISVIDMNGFGGGTGNPAFDTFNPIIEGNSNYPNNPNVRFQGGALSPPLAPGSCTINGGSAGVFTLTKDSSLNDKIARSPILQNTSDMMLGWSLDTTYNNGPSPFGCQGGGGNLCANTGLKQVAITIDGSAINPATGGVAGGNQVLIDGGPNLVSWSPHPNPPPLAFPPLCVSPYLGGQEPTAVDAGAQNLLVGGDAFGNPETGTPPSGLISSQGVTFFQGPSRAGTTPCATYGLRQQVGHFLYVVDRSRRELVVLNSNRMTVIDRILLPDPTSLAVGPNLDVLAVTNQTSDLVSMIDIDPNSASFHTVIKNVLVEAGPRGVAWDPGNEDLMVACEEANAVAVISAWSLEVRKTVSANLTQPFDIAITPRQSNFGFRRNVYFAYILNRTGDVSIYESGPNTVNGWGYDDVIGVANQRFLNPKGIQPDILELRSGVWVLHEGPLNPTTGQLDGLVSEGAATNLVVTSGVVGAIPLSVQAFSIPNFRDMNIAIKISMGEDRLSGVPVDMAFDNMLNLGAVINFSTQFSAGSPIPLNGKALVRSTVNTNSAAPVSVPRFAFFAVPNPQQGTGVVDVILMDGPFLRFDTNAFQDGIQSIPAEDCQVLMDYFRQ